MKKSVENICLKFGAEKGKREERYILKTKIGTLFITDRKDNTFIPMMFDHDLNLSEFLRITHDNTINPYSFKWNLHSSDKKFNLDRLEQRLDFINRNFCNYENN